MTGLAGKTILVSGGSRGIGLAIALRAAADGAIDTLMSYDWPGNVRELENIVERAMIIHRNEPLRFDELRRRSPLGSDVEPAISADPLELDAVMSRHIERVLNIAGGRVHGPGGAGELLGMNPNTLRSKMKKLGISFRSRQKD